MLEAKDLNRSVAAGWGERIVLAIGASHEAARATIEHLLEAEDSGHPSHGLRMLVAMAKAADQGYLDPSAAPTVTTSRATGTINGRNGLGPPIGRLATACAVDIARKHGAGAVALWACGSLGRLAPYAAAAAADGCALLLFANDSGANQRVVPAGGIDGRLSTNPVAFAFPRRAAPHLVVDMATSAYALGTLAALRDAARPIPDDALVKESPQLLLPMAGHKGFALALMVEALAGALTGAGVVRRQEPPASQGALLIAVDVRAFRPLASASLDIEDAIAWVRTSRSAGGGMIRIPGEGARDAETVTIPCGVWSQLAALSERLGEAVPDG